MADAFVYWVSDGGGEDCGSRPKVLIDWIRAQGNASLIVNGGDIYERGTDDNFALFHQQMGQDVSLLCETPGNHDWKTTVTSQATGRIPAGYEAFWSRFPPPLSKQPIDQSRKGGARYEHYFEINGWRLIFLDTGPTSSSSPWPIGDASRAGWFDQALSAPGRAKIIFAHHSRLSRGLHGDNAGAKNIWKALFDSQGHPRATLTVAGHDHNVSVYGPRGRDQPENGSIAFADGVHVLVNGAGGAGSYVDSTGSVPDLAHDVDNYCVTRIRLIDAQNAEVDVLSFGTTPGPGTVPSLLSGSRLRLSV